MPSGKPRRHGRNQVGRPSNKDRIDELQAEIVRLRELILHRRYDDRTWRMIDRVLKAINELESLDTPLQSNSITPTHVAANAEKQVLPGVTITPRGFQHAGSYAARLNEWLHRQIEWAAQTVENNLHSKEQTPKPRMPKRENYQYRPDPENPASELENVDVPTTRWYP